jgi:hypothetical protein
MQHLPVREALHADTEASGEKSVLGTHQGRS